MALDGKFTNSSDSLFQGARLYQVAYAENVGTMLFSGYNHGGATQVYIVTPSRNFGTLSDSDKYRKDAWKWMTNSVIHAFSNGLNLSCVFLALNTFRTRSIFFSLVPFRKPNQWGRLRQIRGHRKRQQNIHGRRRQEKHRNFLQHRSNAQLVQRQFARRSSKQKMGFNGKSAECCRLCCNCSRE